MIFNKVILWGYHVLFNITFYGNEMLYILITTKVEIIKKY